MIDELMVHTSLNTVDTTLASAGTGKTTNIVRLMAEAIDLGALPERILGTTFTVKAADELVERAREYLLAAGRVEEATRLLQARLGTINSVCGGLASEFAFELGRSPLTEVIPEEGVSAAFATAADETIAEFAPALQSLAETFGLPERKIDWREEVRRIIELARANGIAAEQLAVSADRSIASLLALLPDPIDVSEADLDGALKAEINAALAAIDGVELLSGSAGFVDTLKGAARTHSRGEQLPWSVWAGLAKGKVTKRDAPHFNGVEQAALVHPRHPRLRRDLERFIRLSFDCAARALSAYQGYKAERGLLDFVDQETLALELLRHPDAQERLRERIGLVLIDEVQDASPLQVAIFTELARIAGRSVWVGDPKQSIFGFRSTDASLTMAASQGIAAGTGGKSGILSKSWRSRPGICEFVNDAFVPAFEAMGLPPASSRFTECDCDDSGLTRPPLTVWHLTGTKKELHAASLAGGICEALASPDEWLVRGENKTVRGLRAGDIAVLCRSNEDVEEVALALSAVGVPVAVDRGDLFSAPEIEITVAALRWTADRRDRLALAEMARLIGGTRSPSAWLDAATSDIPDDDLRALLPFAPVLEDLRERQLGMTPCEIVDCLIMSTGVLDLACRWGDAAARLHHLEAFRGLACAYEQSAARLRLPATLGGLAAWLSSQKASRPKTTDGSAVQIMTYHKAKGLEWPVVVLAQLGRGSWPNLFRPAVEVDGEIDWRDPLARRWIRHWPWPYGQQSKDVHLDVAAVNDEIGRRAAKQAAEEAVRLLYVGMTRARDHLVLSRTSKPLGWLSELDVGPDPHVVLPAFDGHPIRVAGNEHRARFQVVKPALDEARRAPEPLFLPVERPLSELRPLRLRPSASEQAATFRAKCRTELGGRIPITGSPEMDVLGQAVHAFIAADQAGADRLARSDKARRVLERWDVLGHLGPDGLIAAADNLWAFLGRRFPGARVRRELPVFAAIETQTIVGRIDLLLEWDDRFVIVDHKSFPGRESHWETKAASYGPQLDLYAKAVTAASGKSCTDLLVHMPLVGVVIELDLLTAGVDVLAS